MKSVRRLYFYAVALISIEVVLWGLIDLMRSTIGGEVGGSGEVLARALALTLVGLPIFLFHWLWAQRLAASDEEERTSSLRAIFLHGILLATLIPLVQNLLALIDRSLLLASRLDPGRALFGPAGTAADNLIAIFINGLVALYFWRIRGAEWKALPSRENFSDVRRLYRYLWVIYGLLMTVFGAQQLLRYAMFVPTGLLGEITRDTLINGLALLVVGTPLWVYSWALVQRSRTDPEERDSNLRLAILYILALGGVITVLTTAAMVLHILLDVLLGTRMTAPEILNKVGGPLSVGLPLGAVWAYYGNWLARHIDAEADIVRRLAARRIYSYMLSALGLGGTFIGVAQLISFLIRLLTGAQLLLEDAFRSDLARAVSVIVAWLPLWLVAWRAAQAEILVAGDAGDHARRSVVRRTYLYAALFAGVIGAMASAVSLVFELLNAALTGERAAALLTTVLNDLQLLVLFLVLLVYHLLILRKDGRSAAEALATRQRAFRVLVIDSGGGFGEQVGNAIASVAPNIPVTLASRKPRGSFDAMIVSGSQLFDAPQWIRTFRGARIVVPERTQDLHWAGLDDPRAFQKAALAARRLAEGQLPEQTTRRGNWMIVVYIAAALFGLEMLLAVIGLLLSTFLD